MMSVTLDASEFKASSSSSRKGFFNLWVQVQAITLSEHLPLTTIVTLAEGLVVIA